MSKLNIKKITSATDLSACAPLLVSAYNGAPWNDNWTAAKALEKLDCFFNSPKFLGWMAYDGEALVGACVGNIEPYFTGDYFYLKEMFVPGAAQRSGTGSALMTQIKADLKTMDIETVVLFTSNAAFPWQFWQKQGFEEMETMRMMGLGAGE